MILILDHEDSFTYNIYAAVRALDSMCQVVSTRDAFVSLDALVPTVKGLILSPGPGHPKDATLFYKALDLYLDKVPVLGVCLGHQAIARHFGADVLPAKEVVHGKSVSVEHDGKNLFKDMPSPFLAMRYNSLTVAQELTPGLAVTAWSGDDVMGLRHLDIDVQGVQFHPESVGTPEGIRLIANFVKHVKAQSTK